MKHDEARALMIKLNDETQYTDCCIIESSKGNYDVYSQTFGKIHIVKKEEVQK